MKIYGGIEAGGTKHVCIAASGPDQIEAEIRFPTTTPDETLRRTVAFFEPFARAGRLAAIGIGAFGPVDLNPASPTYGYVTTTPKPGWRYTNYKETIEQALQVPVAFDTDVNAAALGEVTWAPENRGLDPFVYVTIGTGIGAGALVNGRPVHGLVHMEAGHMRLPHDRQADPFEGSCPFHGDCFEGLAAGGAIAQRWGRPGPELPSEHPAWALEAHYIALATVNLVYCLSPQRVVLGGGVMAAPGLIERVRQEIPQISNGYFVTPAMAEEIDRFVTRPALGARSGGLGAIAMARRLAAGEA